MTQQQQKEEIANTTETITEDLETGNSSNDLAASSEFPGDELPREVEETSPLSQNHTIVVDATTNDEDEDEDPLTIHWKKSPFAVGKVNIHWSDELKGTCCASPHQISGLVCGKLFHARRLGNMSVLIQHTSSNNPQNAPPRLIWVVGPFWFVMLFVTVPLILGFSSLVYLKFLSDHVFWIQMVWTVSTALLLVSLIMVSWSNPGILPRHTSPVEDNWTWNDQAKTYRPPTAKYDPICAVVVEEFDHVCPWTGTAIGKGNMGWFRRFLSMLGLCMFIDILLITF